LIDEDAQILIIFRREEHCDSEGAILTADITEWKIAGMGWSVEPDSDNQVRIERRTQLCIAKSLSRWMVQKERWRK